MPVRRTWDRLFRALDGVGRPTVNQDQLLTDLGPLQDILAGELVTGGGENVGPVAAGTTLQSITLNEGWHYLSASISINIAVSTQVRAAAEIASPDAVARMVWLLAVAPAQKPSDIIDIPYLIYIPAGNWIWRTRLQNAIVAGDGLTSVLNDYRVYQENIQVRGTAAF